MSEVQPSIPEQSQGQTQIPTNSVSPVVSAPPAKHGFSGKQVVGIVFGVLILLAIGLAIGGAIGYRLGTAEGAQVALANRTVLRAQPQQAPNQQTPNQQAPRSFTVPAQPFNGQQSPALNPGGPYLGVTFQIITSDVAAQEGITGTTGALVREVVTGGPAAQAGLKPGDVITAVNGKAVDDTNDLRSRVAEFKSGDEITLTIVKGTANGPTDQRDVKVKLGERPAEQSFDFQLPLDPNGLPQLPEGLPQLPFGGQGQSGQAPAATGAYLGVELEMTNTLTVTPGTLIKTVVAGSPAAKAGLKTGDVIVAVDGKPISDANNLRDVIQGHKSGDEITLTIVASTPSGPADRRDVKVVLTVRPVQRQFQMPPGFQPGAPGLDSREG
jgi:membrane-associated protease RseP (regulator of RpoE activity)